MEACSSWTDEPWLSARFTFVGRSHSTACTPEKTRHKKYAAEALAATVEFFNALHESKKVDIHACTYK